jgi:hypothetical protein
MMIINLIKSSLDVIKEEKFYSEKYIYRKKLNKDQGNAYEDEKQ